MDIHLFQFIGVYSIWCRRRRRLEIKIAYIDRFEKCKHHTRM